MYEETAKRSERLRIGIKWKMFAILIIFISILVVTMWLFQMSMANYFYQQSRFNEMKTTALTVSGSLGDAQRTDEIMAHCAETYDVNLWLFSLEGDTLREIGYTSDSAKESAILRQVMVNLYARAVANENNYIVMLPSSDLNGSANLEILADNTGDPESFPILPASVERCDAYYSTVLLVGERVYFLVQNANLTPLPSMITMLENMFLITGVFVIVLALVLSFVLARLITKPLVQMNAAAKRLAKGEYSADFSGRGYREITELGDTLNYAAHELSKNDKLQKELIANVSHDLRTPLTMICGYSEVMRDIPGENTPENVQVIIDEANRLSELVNDMLDLSRVQAGTRAPEMERFSLTDTVRDVMKRYEKLTEQQGYQIRFLATETAYVKADRGMILQVLYNLINNAVNYTGEDRLVTVSQQVVGGRVRICVTDTGEGITEEQIPLIWDRYYKVDRVHRRAMVGTGLGLSIVKGVLEAHQASFGVQSTPGKGSTFWFELDIALPEREEENSDSEVI